MSLVQKSNDNCSVDQPLKEFELIIDKLQSLLNNQAERNGQLVSIATKLAGYQLDVEKEEYSTSTYPDSFSGNINNILSKMESQHSILNDVIYFLNRKV